MTMLMTLHRQRSRIEWVKFHLLLLVNAMSRYVEIGMHFACPFPRGGGRSAKFQFADSGTQLKMRVKNVKSMKATRKTIPGLVVVLNLKQFEPLLTDHEPAKSAIAGPTSEREEEEGY